MIYIQIYETLYHNKHVQSYFFFKFYNFHYNIYHNKNVPSHSTFILAHETENVALLDESHISQIASEINLSERKQSTLLKIFKNQKLIKTTKNVLFKYKEQRKSLSEYFDTSDINFEVTNGQEELRPILYCSD